MKSPFLSWSRLWPLLLILWTTQAALTQNNTLRLGSSALSPPERPLSRYLELGFGATLHRLQDPAVSPMIYTGGPIAIELGFEKRKPHSISRFALSGDIGRLDSKNATELRPMASNYFQADLSYQYLRRLPALSANRFTWFLGGQYRWHNSIRLTPQNDTGFITFLIANSISVAARGETALQLFGRQVELGWIGSLPLLSHVIRPSYLNLYNYLDPEHDWLQERLEASEILTFNRFPGFQSRLEFTYPIANGNQLRFAYDWGFYHYNGSRRVNAGRHGFTVGIRVRM